MATTSPACPADGNRDNGALAWSPDGRRIAAIGNSGALASVVLVVDPDGRNPPRTLVDLPVDARLRGVTWSADGASLIVGEQRRFSDIVLFEMTK